MCLGVEPANMTAFQANCTDRFMNASIHPPAGDKKRRLRVLLGYRAGGNEDRRVVLPGWQRHLGSRGACLEILQRVEI
jgi:hypothetical protein